MFPVLVSLNNFDAALKPGMNGQVVMDIARHDNVLAVPSDAIRNARDAGTVATVLGVTPDSIRATIAAARQARGLARGTASSTPSGAASSTRSGTASAFGQRGGFNRQGGAGGAGGAGAAASFASSTSGGGGPMIVFVKKGDKYTPRVVRVGISDFDNTEILNGLQQGEQVALLGAAVLQAQREQVQARVRAGTGAGLQQQQAPTTGTGGAGGGGGGARGGGGGRPPGT